MTALTSCLPRRSRLATPTTATASTVISTIVSKPAEVGEDHGDDVAAVRLGRARGCARPRRCSTRLGRDSAPRSSRTRAAPAIDAGRGVAPAPARGARGGASRRGARQAREDADEHEREDRLDERPRRARRRARRRPRRRRPARSRAPRAPAPAAAGPRSRDDRERRRDREREQRDDRQVVARRPRRRRRRRSVGRGAKPERDEHAARDEHRREAGAQVAHLGVVEPVRAAGSAPCSADAVASAAARPTSPARATARRDPVARGRGATSRSAAERPRRERHHVLRARVEVVGGSDVDRARRA